MTDPIQAAIARISGPDTGAMNAAARRQQLLTKPPGSLGRLESLSIALAGARGDALPRVTPFVIVLAAASHAIAEEGVSAYPAAVTHQMVLNFLSGGAAINALSRSVGAKVVVVDAGVEPAVAPHPGLISLGLGRGSRNFLKESALTSDEATRAIIAGIALAQKLVDEGACMIGLGEMGIGNTTAAAAVAACVLQRSAAEVTGRGTMVDDAAYQTKLSVIEQALERHRVTSSTGLGLLAAFGGAETGVLAGAILGAASRRVPVLLDGFPSTAAALIADRFTPAVRPYLFASHRSYEPGHAACLRYLELEPLLDLGLRLGEGTGAALAYPIMNAAARALCEMATFAEAGVEDREQS